MDKLFIFFALLVGFSTGWSQEIKVDFDNHRDYTQYKTFRFGEGEIITPKDQQQVNEKDVHKWIKTAVTLELEMKGLHHVDTAADLVVSYAVGTLERSDAGNLGPMGLTPGSMERTYMRDYRQGSLIIDLNDTNDFRVWRIYSTSDMTGPAGERTVDQIVQKGFKQFAKPVKVKKKNKNK